MTVPAMPAPRPSDVRNIGIVAHINAGKTTLSERILFDTGKQRFMGEVDEGTATMDWMPEEQRRGISITAAVTTVEWRGRRMHLIDTPGHVDFTAEVERCLRVLDGVVVLLDGVRGVESQTETIWRQAGARGVPRLVFVNKMDRAAADFAGSLRALGQRLQCPALPIVLPLRRDGDLVGLIDAVAGELRPFAADAGPRADGAAELPMDVEAARMAVVEACAELDEELLADFVEGRPISTERLQSSLRRAVLGGQVVPVLCGSALRNQGVDLLLDAVALYLPAPSDLPPVRGVGEGIGGHEQLRSASPAAPFSGLVFKSQRLGSDVLHLVRVYSGLLGRGDRVGTTAAAGSLRVLRVWRLHAAFREQVEAAGPGDVVGIETDAPVATGDSLYAERAPIRLEPARFPHPVLAARLEPQSAADLPAIEQAARELVLEDPTLRLDLDADTGVLTVTGMGELHLEVFGTLLAQATGQRVRLGKPRVAHRETVTGVGRGVGEWRVPDAAGERWARVEVEVAPAPGAGDAVVTDGDGGAADSGGSEPGAEPSAGTTSTSNGGPGRMPRPPRIPSDLRRSLIEELAAQARHGLHHPHPARDLTVRLLGVEGTAASEMDQMLFFEALRVAVRRAMAQAGPQILEPVLWFEVACPSDAVSAVLADLRSRGATVTLVDSAHVDGGQGAARIQGRVALAPMLGYATRLRSITRGLGSVTLLPHGFAPLPEKDRRGLDSYKGDR